MTYFLFAELRTFPGKMAIQLSCAMIALQLVYLASDPDVVSWAVCAVMGALLHYLNLVVFLWTGCIAHDTHKTFTNPSKCIALCLCFCYQKNTLWPDAGLVPRPFTAKRFQLQLHGRIWVRDKSNAFLHQCKWVSGYLPNTKETGPWSGGGKGGGDTHLSSACISQK